MTVMLLHDLGDPDAGDVWRSVAPPDWIVPDLPGHGNTPAPRNGHYDPMAPIAIARWSLTVDGDATLIGVAAHAHSALVHAAGGGCDRVIVVDGLGGPWRAPSEQIDTYYQSLRSIVADRSATDSPPDRGLDPRATYPYGILTSAAFSQRFWAAIECPVAAIETPKSPTPREERAERLAWFGGPTTLYELDTADPSAVVSAALQWLNS